MRSCTMSAHRNVSCVANETPETSTRKGAHKSPCWDHFDKINPRTEKRKVKGREVVVKFVTAKCKHCPREIQHTSSQGTSHLTYHVKSCPGLKDARERTDALGTGSVDDTDVHDILLAKAMAKYGYRYDMISHSLFQQYVQSLHPGYQLPSEERMGELFSRIFLDEMDKLSQVSANVSSRISLSISKQDPYVYMTACFIDESWNWQQRIVGSLHLNDIDKSIGFLFCAPTTMDYYRPLNIVTMNDEAVNFLSDRICQYLCEELGDTEVKSFESLDTRLRNDLFSDDMEITSDNDNDDLDECLFGVSILNCCNFRIKCAIEVIDKAAEKGTSLYIDIHKKRSLRNPIPSSWTGAFSQAERMWSDNNFQHPFYYPYLYARLNKEELERLRVLRECWTYFHSASMLLKEFNYVSSGVFFVKLCEMQWFLTNQPIHVDEEINAMVREMKRILDVYWGSHKIILSITCFLDPRYKMTKIKEHYSLIFENDGECTKFKAVVIYLMNLYTQMEGSNDCSSEKCENELERYLSEECLQVTGRNKINVLKWWKDNEKFKILKIMAKDILGIPLVSTTKASLVHDFIQLKSWESTSKVYFPYQWDFEEVGDALCLYVWLNDYVCLEDENEERTENTHREEPYN